MRVKWILTSRSQPSTCFNLIELGGGGGTFLYRAPAFKGNGVKNAARYRLRHRYRGKKRKKTTRRATPAIWRKFAGLDKHNIEDELNIDAGKHVLAVFLN